MARLAGVVARPLGHERPKESIFLQEYLGKGFKNICAVAGINTQGAGDAADLRPFANVDARRADRNTLLAIDAIAVGFGVAALGVGTGALDEAVVSELEIVRKS